MTRPIPVLIVIDHLHTGGAQEFVWQLCCHTPRDQVQISVCALRAGGIYSLRLKSININVIELAPSKEKRWLPVIAFKAARLIFEKRYAIIHTFLENSFTLCSPLARMSGIPTLHTIVAIQKQSPSWYFPLMNIYQRFVLAYLSFHPPESHRFGIQPHKIRAVEMAINIEEFLAIERDPFQELSKIPLEPSNLVITSIARLHPDKGHEYLIRAWPRVLEYLPEARLLIVGEGEDQLRLQTLIDELGMKCTIYMPGYRADIKEILQRTNIFVRPSINEGVNLITIQAMATGLPAIGFRTDAPKEIIVPNHNGVLVSLQNIDALADAIIHLGSRADLRTRYGLNAREGVRDYYDANHIFEYYLKLYKMITKSHDLKEVTDMISRPWPFTSSLQATGENNAT